MASRANRESEEEKGFTSYCAISNTVKAIGIGGSASLFVTVKMSSFLADSQEAEARNLVALTRSKGLCLLLFPTTHVHPTGPLHSLRTLCALRHGMFHIGKDRVDLDSFAAFLTQPDTVEFAHDGITIDSCAPFTRESWLFTHQISSYGAWTFHNNKGALNSYPLSVLGWHLSGGINGTKLPPPISPHITQIRKLSCNCTKQLIRRDPHATAPASR